jgi:hypothetical protein
MSRGEYLFDPRALARVANAVEWEPELRYYKDGHSNQEFYVQAMVMLMERWLREFSLPDLLLALRSAGGGDWPGLLRQGIGGLREKVEQLRGFWEGLWYGANPRGSSLARSIRAGLVPYLPVPVDSESAVAGEAEMLAVLSSFFSRLRELSDDQFTKPAVLPKGGA